MQFPGPLTKLAPNPLEDRIDLGNTRAGLTWRWHLPRLELFKDSRPEEVVLKNCLTFQMIIEVQVGHLYLCVVASGAMDS